MDPKIQEEKQKEQNHQEKYTKDFFISQIDSIRRTQTTRDVLSYTTSFFSFSFIPCQRLIESENLRAEKSKANKDHSHDPMAKLIQTENQSHPIYSGE